MEKKTLIISSVVLVSGGLVYWWWLKKHQPAAVATSTPAAPAAVGIKPTISISTPIASAAPTAATSIASSAAANLPPAVITFVNQGLGPNNQAQFYKMLPSMDPADIDQLNKIMVQNLWGTEGIKDWWNTWRVKYHILDGTYLNFTDAGRVSDLLNYRWAA